MLFAIHLLAMLVLLIKDRKNQDFFLTTDSLRLPDGGRTVSANQSSISQRDAFGRNQNWLLESFFNLQSSRIINDQMQGG